MDKFVQSVKWSAIVIRKVESLSQEKLK